MPIISTFSISKDDDGLMTIGMAPPQAIGGWTMEYRLVKNFGYASGMAFMSCASGYNGVSGITVVNSGQGVFTIPIKAALASGLNYGNYGGIVRRTDSGNATTIAEIFITFNP